MGTKLEVVFGASQSRTSTYLRVVVSDATILIGSDITAAPFAPHHDLVELVAACYVCAAALHIVIGEDLLIDGRSPSDSLTVDIAMIFGPDRSWLDREFHFHDSYLAGAGAIGNGFIYALALLKPSGHLHIVDYDYVDGGNLNRCVWFEASDVDERKTDALIRRAQPFFTKLRLEPIPHSFEKVKVGRDNNVRWLAQLIVAVDSPRARRSLQSEIPGEVFDASTTGVREIVLHHNQQPTELACLSCIYEETPDETARARSIADNLGLTLEQVQKGVIDKHAATAIRLKYPELENQSLEGLAVDSLFRELCATAALKTTEHEQVFAPFAFVSVLAGAYLAIDFARRSVQGRESVGYNYWRINPWVAPVEAVRQTLSRYPKCEFCSNPILRKVTQDIWGALDGPGQVS